MGRPVTDQRPRVAGIPFGSEPVAPPVPLAVGQVAISAMIDPRVHVVLTLEEASLLLAWLASLADVACPPIGRQLRTALLDALAEA